MRTKNHSLRKTAIATSATMALFAMGSALAAPIDVGNEDLSVRWDNTVRYNYMHRVESQDPNILATPNSDDGDRNFNKGTVSNRLDLLSEFDVVYRNRHGIRITGAAWVDGAYGSLDNNSVGTSNHLVGGVPALGLSNNTKRFHKGPSGEFLDAFAFTQLELGDSLLNLKLGRTTAFWGEGFLSPIHSLSYGQSPLDLRKAASVPGTELKELFLPRNQLLAQWQVNPTVSVAAQYFLDWKPVRLPEAGSYLGSADFWLDGGEALRLPPALVPPGAPPYFTRGADISPKNGGDYGLSARWTSQWLGGTAGVYYRKTSDIQPQVHLSPFTGQYMNVYPGGIDIFGVSLSKGIGGVSVGAEMNYRENMPLLSNFAAAIPALPARGETLGARGNTLHGVVNVLGSIGKTALFDDVNYVAELQYSQWTKVTQGASEFLGTNGYNGIDKPTKRSLGFSMNVTPVWYGVYPNVDLYLPISYSTGLSGTSAVAGGGNKNAGNYSVGVGVDVQQRYRFDLKYVDSFGPYVGSAVGGLSSFTPSSVTRDRGFISLTFKTTF